MKWPDMSIGLIRGSAALTLTDKNKKPLRNTDSERIRIFISMTIWAIWKARNMHTMNDSPAPPSETPKLMKTLLKDLITKSWNSTQFSPPELKKKKEERIKKLWKDGTIVTFDRGKPPNFDF
jgi:hypothetical protein